MATLGSMRQSLSLAGGRGALERLGMLVFPLLLLFDLLSTAEGQATAPQTGLNCTMKSEKCKDGIFLPMWLPQGELSNGDKAARAIVYLLSMIYMFLGVSIVADRFMAAIEVITLSLIHI